jgi:integrase
MSVKLRERPNSDGTTSLYLDIYTNGRRAYEFLHHLKLCKEANAVDRANNRNKKALAEQIAMTKSLDLSARGYDMATETGKKTVVTIWMDNYVKKYKKKDIRNMAGVLKDFKAFLVEEKKRDLTFGELTSLLIEDFQEYLGEHHEGEGAGSYFSRFKKMMKRAYKEGVMTRNHAAEVQTKSGTAKNRKTLTLEEIKILSQTPISNPIIKNAALFSLMTGLAWVDINTLQWVHIDMKNKTMDKPRQKTEQNTFQNLNTTAIQILKEQGPGKPKEYVFEGLPTPNGCNKSLKKWVKDADIDKKITWHNLRHSVGVILAASGADLLTIGSVLGHSKKSGTRHTMRYTRAAEQLKQQAMKNLEIEL